MRDVTRRAKAKRSTASASPAGTRVASAHARISEPARRSSALSRPAGDSTASERSEFEQTISASSGVECAADITSGF